MEAQSAIQMNLQPSVFCLLYQHWLDPFLIGTVIVPFIRKSASAVEGWMVRPTQKLLVGLVNSSERCCLTADVGVMNFYLSAVSVFNYLSQFIRTKLGLTDPEILQ